VVVLGLVFGWFVLRRDPGLLVTDETGTVSRIDLVTGVTEFTITDAVAAPDKSKVYRTESAGDGTLLEELDPRSGEVVGSVELAGELEIRAVSPAGGAVALMAPKTRSSDLYVPEPREYTSINVVWDDGRSPRNYTLKGNFEPETFSTDETTLFLIEFWPATQPDRYYVRQLDLGSGKVSEVSATEVELNPEMRGHARAQVMAPDGRYLYSLYTMAAGEDPVHAPGVVGDSARWAFVHTLNLKEKWSFCIFLPVPFGTGPESRISMGVSGDGRALFVVDAVNDHLAEIDTRRLRVKRVEELRGLETGPGSPPVAVGERTIYVGMVDTVLEVDRRSLIPSAAFVIGDDSRTFSIAGLDLAPDGHTLRISHAGSISVVDMATERIIATLASPGRGGASFVGPSVGHRTEIDLTWVIP
jgi:DNA-binding beta-propeller fold protein YncE